MQSTALLAVAFLLEASAAGTPAPDDSTADKENGSAAASDLERKGETAAAQGSGLLSPTARGRKDTQRRRDADTDADQGSGEVDGELGSEGIKPK
jgi:hypothetical protein